MFLDLARANLVLAAVLAMAGSIAGQTATADLHGLVLDRAANALANADVEVFDGQRRLATATTGADGRFDIPALPLRRVQVIARAKEHALRAQEVDLIDFDTRHVRLQLFDGRSVHGRVLQDERPVIGATVFACSTTWSGQPDAGIAAPHTTTDNEGRYRLDHVPFGPLTVRAWHPGTAIACHQDDGVDDEIGDVTLTATTTAVTFSLVDATPAQIETTTFFVRTDHALPPILAFGRPDAAGNWVATAPPGDWRTDCELQDHGVVPASNLRMSREFARFRPLAQSLLRGRLTSSQGVPLADRDLLVQPEHRREPRFLARTGADGSFAVPLPDPDYALRLLDRELAVADPADDAPKGAPQLRPKTRPLARSVWHMAHADGTAAEIVAEPAHKIVGSVAATDMDLTGVTVHLWNGRREVGSATCAADGTFLIHGIRLAEDVEHTLYFDNNGPSWMTTMTPSTPERVEVRGTASTAVVQGFVRDASGVAVPGALVELVDDGSHRHMLSGRDGSFRFTGATARTIVKANDQSRSGLAWCGGEGEPDIVELILR
ncbi:MAG: carboxypeptidase regulatory-like domain-containing protein [Planctomycetes bacterium]|nr:carboxypeptidase regulatory-like domain-containing protein [Planctomycetota bacterium]